MFKALAACAALGLLSNCAPSDAEAIDLRIKAKGKTGLVSSGSLRYRDTKSFYANTSNESYTCPDMPAILSSGSNFNRASISVWAKPAACGFATIGAAKSSELLLFGRADCRIRMIMTSNSANYCETVINMEAANTWVHILGVYDGTGSTDADKCKIFINGVNQVELFGGALPINMAEASTSLVTGGQQVGTWGDMAYWYTDQSANAVEIYNGGKGYDLRKFGPAAWYTHDHPSDAAGTGGTLNDMSGRGYVCTESNTEAGDIVTDVP